MSFPAPFESILRCAFAAILLASSAPSALALTQEAAVEKCRGTVGQPMVRACMQSLGGGKAPDAEANRAACRAKATPQVRACVMAALNAANGRANVALGVPTEVAAKAAAAGTAPAGFVAPPRTIADVTAILDSERPDVRTIEQLQRARIESRF